MEKITNILNVWDNGAIGDYFLSGEEIDKFKLRTGATKVTGHRWTYQGITYETSSWIVRLPDEASLVYGDRGNPGCNKKLFVLNGDNTVRCEIVPPVLNIDVSKIDPAVYRVNKNDPRTARPYLVYPPTPEIAQALLPPKRRGKGWLALPTGNWSPDYWCGITYGCEGEDDGDGKSYLFEFDWNTGALLKAVHSPRSW